MRKQFFILLFVLIGLSLNAGELFRFALITDLHVGNPDNNEDLLRTVNDINSLKNIAFVIASGDITEFGSHDELTTAKSILDKLSIPYYAIPGNHDSNWSESGNNDFLRVFGRETFSLEYAGYKLIGLASGPTMKMGPGQIPRENVEWLAVELEKTDRATPLIYVNHYPMDKGLNNWFEVMDALKPFNVQLMLCGHGHVNKALNFEGVNAAMCRSNLRAKQTFGGYTLITVRADSILLQERVVSGETRLPWLGYSTTNRPQWETNPPRPDYSINRNQNYVKEVWSIQEDSDIGSGMHLSKNKLIYTTTSGSLTAVNTKNGSQLWSATTRGKVYSTPVIHDNKVWVASSDSYLYGFNSRNGKLIHRLKTNKPVVSSPVCSDTKVMLAGGDGTCRAWDVNSGSLIWTFDSVRNFVVTRPLLHKDILYFGSWGNELYALDVATGNSRWIWNSGNSNRMLSPAQVVPVASQGRIYIASPDRFMTVLDATTGSVIWRFNDPDNRVRESIGISQDGKIVYAKTMDGKVLAIDATVPDRKVKWISSGEDMGYELAPTPVVEQSGVVYAPTDKGLIYAFRASDGLFLWKYRVSIGLITMILPSTNGELYVSAMDGKIVKLKVLN
jgi:outer membrane protein assembly factor BamB/predicted phosphodiesterase